MTATGEQGTNIGATYALSFAGAVLVYMSLFIYGAQVMRGCYRGKNQPDHPGDRFIGEAVPTDDG